MTRLNIADGFSLPLEMVTSTQAILARKRSGKSYTASVEAEEMLERGHQIAVIDPTSAWFGLRSSADGKGPGYPVAVFGGEHADAPLDFRSGKAMARAIVEHGFSAIFDIGNWITDEQIQFVFEFTSELLRINRTAIHLFIDEADTFAPQLLEGKEQKKCLGATSRLVKQGGIKGIGVTMISQRSADLNKKVLSQIDMLTALRMSHPPDIKPVMDWISTNIAPQYAEEVGSQLPRLSIGEAFVCNGPTGKGERIRVRERRTFNSGATPKPGERRIEPKVLAQIDINKLGAEIQASVEKAKADDPQVLKQKIAQLEEELRKASQAKPVAAPIELKPDPVAITKLIEEEMERYFLAAHAKIGLPMVQRLEKLARELMDLLHQLGEMATAIREPERWNPRHISATGQNFAPTLPLLRNSDDSPRPQPAHGATGSQGTRIPVRTAPRRSQGDSGGSLAGPHRRILNAIAWFESIGVTDPEQPAVAFLAGYSATSSSFGVPKSQLKGQGMVEYLPDGRIALTETGRAAAEIGFVPRTNEGLQGAVLAKLGGPERRLLEPLLRHYPKAMGNEHLAEAAGYSVSSSSYGVPRSRLKSFGLIEYPHPGLVRAGDLLFPMGV